MGVALKALFCAPFQAEDAFDSEPKIKKLEPVLLPGERRGSRQVLGRGVPWGRSPRLFTF